MESEAKGSTEGRKAAPREQAVPPSPAPQPRAIFSNAHEIPESLRYLFPNLKVGSTVPPGFEGTPKNQSVPQAEKENAAGVPSAEPNQQMGRDAATILQAAMNLSSSKSETEEGKPKVKEAETIKLLPDFRSPETYRSWRTSVREVVRAASDRPDEAFAWVQEVHNKGVSMESRHETENSSLSTQSC